MDEKVVTFLLVDDDSVDRMAVRRGFKSLKVTNPIVEATNGIEALHRLRGTAGFAKLAGPTIILLDLNMPKMGGIEFLETLRADPELQMTLVFVLTTSAATEDRVRAYKKNASGYVLKSKSNRTFHQALGMFESFARTIEYPCP